MKILLMIFLFFFAECQAQQNDSSRVLLKKGTHIYERPNSYSHVIFILDKQDTVRTFESSGDYLKVFALNVNYVGYANKYDIVRNKMYQDVEAKLLQKEKKKRRQEREKDSLLSVRRISEIDRIRATISKYKSIQNPTSIFRKFFSIKPKSDFETTEAFHKRTQIKEPLEYIFEYTLNYDDQIKYNANDGIFRIFLSNMDFFRIWSDSKYLETYIGQNSFGVKKNIKKYEVTYYNISNFGLVSELRNKNGKAFGNEIFIPVSPKQAAKIKDYFVIKIGVVFKSYNDRDHHIISKNPQIDSPTDITGIEYTIKGQFIFLEIYNKKSRKVYKSYYNIF